MQNPIIGANQTLALYKANVNTSYKTLHQERIQAITAISSNTETEFELNHPYPKHTTALLQYNTALNPAMMKFMGYYLAKEKQVVVRMKILELVDIMFSERGNFRKSLKRF